jgi:hypothetical protein
MQGLWGAWGVFLICAITTAVSILVHAGLPPHGAGELTRQIHLWQGFVAMGLVDALTIALIRWHGKSYPRLTNPLTIVLSCSIINHAFGAFGYAAYNNMALDAYDMIKWFVLISQILVFVWWWGSRHGRRDRRYHPRPACASGYGQHEPLCDHQHKDLDK